MTSFINDVPSDITIYIANQLDIRSFSKFLATCKYANENTRLTFCNKVNDNLDSTLKHIISTVIDYNNLLSLSDNKYQATQNICKSIFKNILDASSATDMDHLLTLLENPIRKIMDLIDGTQQDVHLALNDFISEERVEEELQHVVVEAIQECLFTNEYNVVFELLDSSNKDVKYRFLININLSGDIPELKVSIIDIENDVELCNDDNNVNDYIENAEITCDGELAFTATDESIKNFIKYMCKVFGNGVFTHQLKDEGVQIQICNFLNQPLKCCDFYRKVVDDMLITQQASFKITNYISSNTV